MQIFICFRRRIRPRLDQKLNKCFEQDFLHNNYKKRCELSNVEYSTHGESKNLTLILKYF